MTRRPLCIDSKVVERIDKLSDKGSDTIYRCAVNKETPYSAYFGQQAKELGTRIQQTEKLLESIEPFYKKIQITIMDEHPLLYRIQGHHLFIGSKLLEAPGHLEKALAKIWYRERNETLFAQQDLMEEVFTDFLVYLQSGDLDIGDPNTHLTTAIRKVKWPYILKSVPSYCESSWKQSEHFAICQNVADAEGELKEQVTELSLRPLLVSNWIHSYMKLSMKDRYEFVGNLVRILRADHSIPLPMVTEQIMSAMPEKTLVKAAEAIKNTNLFISSSKLAKDSVAHRTFVANLTNELRSSGFQDAFAEASFDVLLVSQEPLSDDSKTFAEFRKIAKAHPELQFALRDQNNLWMLPAQYPIPLATFGQIRANRTIVEKCGGYNFSYVMDYADTTEKLLVVDRCDHSKAVEYGMFLSDGAEGFGIQNKGVAFVQFHLPSLLMKKAELEQVSNVFEFIQKRDVENPSFKSLGWKEVRWSQQANAYQPKAFVDAIEWFRIPGQDRL